MQNTTIENKITPLLEDITNYLEQLFHVLETEYKALSDSDLTAIQTVAQEKVLLMEQLEDLNKDRRMLLESAGLNLAATGINDLFNSSTITNKPKLKTLWDSISTLSKKCEQQNNINGIIIDNNKRHTENALSVLQGQGNQQTTELYSNKGQSIKTSTKKTSIRA